MSPGVLAVNVSLPAHRYSDMHRRIRFTRQVVERPGAVPGVRAAAASVAQTLGLRERPDLELDVGAWVGQPTHGNTGPGLRAPSAVYIAP